MRDKALLAACLLGVTLIIQPVPGAVVSFVLTNAVALVWAKVPWRLWLQAIAAQWAFLLLTGVGIALQVSFSPLSVGFTTESVQTAVAVVLRATAAVAVTMLLAFTTPVVDLLTSTRKLGVPQAIIDVASVAYRLIFSLYHTARAHRNAQAARCGLRTRSSELRSAATSIGTVLVRAVAQASRLEAGLIGRGDGALRVLPPPTRGSWLLPTMGLGLVGVIVVATAVLGSGPVLAPTIS